MDRDLTIERGVAGVRLRSNAVDRASLDATTIAVVSSPALTAARAAALGRLKAR